MKITPRILFAPKDHPSLPSGYAIVARYLLPHLRDRYGAENIVIYTPVYEHGRLSEWEGMRVVPGTQWGFGENLIEEHYNFYKCNMLLMMGDIWPLGLVPDLAAADKLLWIHYIPVDWLGMPKNVQIRLRPAHKLVPFSKWGENALRQAGLPNVEPAIWLGLNLDLWKPGPRNPEYMEKLGFSEETFNIVFVGANQERKEIRSMLEAVASFRRLVPEARPRLYMHTELKRERDLHADMDQLGLLDIGVYPDDYHYQRGSIIEEDMIEVFRCADVVINLAMEGYGFSNVQAQAVGVPVIHLSEGASPELVQFGIEIPPAGIQTAMNQMSQPYPNVPAAAHALVEMYKRRQENGAPLRSERAIKWVQENLGWKQIAEQWFRVIDQTMEDRITYCMQIPEVPGWLEDKARTLVEIR